MLMAVFNPIEFDGRVKRSASTLALKFDLVVLCPKYGCSAWFKKQIKYQIRSVRLLNLRFQAIKQLFFWFNLIFIAIRLKPKVIYAHDYYLIFPAWIASKIIGALVVYDAHELIVLEDGGQATYRDLFFYKLERALIGKMDLVIAANDERSLIMNEHYGLKKIPTVIKNIPPNKEILMGREYVLRKYNKLKHLNKDDIHILYMGGVDVNRGISMLLESLRFLSHNYICIIIGDGPSMREIGIRYKHYIENGRLRMLGNIINEEIPALLKEGDIGFISYAMSGLNNINCASNKVYEYAQAQLPIVSTAQPPISQILKEYDIGELLPISGDNMPIQVANSIKKIKIKGYYSSGIAKFLDKNKWEYEEIKLLNAINSLKL